MGTEYTLWLHSDDDWQGFARFNVDKDVNAIAPSATRVASFREWLIYDVGRTNPSRFYNKVKCTHMLFTSYPTQDLPRLVSSDGTGYLWWCRVHRRAATHTDKNGKRCCDPKLGGILLPCAVSLIEGAPDTQP